MSMLFRFTENQPSDNFNLLIDSQKVTYYFYRSNKDV